MGTPPPPLPRADKVYHFIPFNAPMFIPTIQLNTEEKFSYIVISNAIIKSESTQQPKSNTDFQIPWGAMALFTSLSMSNHDHYKSQ